VTDESAGESRSPNGSHRVMKLSTSITTMVRVNAQIGRARLSAFELPCLRA
jgi:hypothetical protein